MKDNQSLTQYKSRLNVTALEKIGNRQTISKISNAVCIENLVKKNSMFAPSKVQPLPFEHSSKALYGLTKLSYKKQIQPHQNRSVDSFIGKSKISLLNQKMPQLKQSKHSRHVSAMWQSKKMNRGKRLQSVDGQPYTASFYLKKGGQPYHYQLKMEIKKVEIIKEDQNDQKKYHKSKLKSRNYLLNMDCSDANRQQNLSSGLGESIQIKNQVEQLISVQKCSQPLKIRYNKQRYIKSTLMSSYSTKTKLNKKKQEEQAPQLSHIKNIINHKLNINEETVPLFQLQWFEIPRQEYSAGQAIIQKTADHISVYHINNLKKIMTPIFLKDPHKRVQIASITKIMTCFLVIKIAQFFKMDIMTEKVVVSERASKMPGTSAGLNYSDTLIIYDLLHGLMLPSGNDAAISLAQWGGKVIRKYCNIARKYSEPKLNGDTKSLHFLADYLAQKKSYQKLFIFHMNKMANVMKLKNTRFANTHGLMNDKAYSTSNDVAKLTQIAMSNAQFREIVGRKQFSCKIFNRTYSQTKNVTWKNTNKLLDINGFIGVKTGVTPSAGPCLSSMFSINKNQQVVIVVLNVKSMEMRFKQSLSLLKESLSILGINMLQNAFIKPSQDGQSTEDSSNDNAEQANLIDEQKQISSDQEEIDQDEEDQH